MLDDTEITAVFGDDGRLAAGGDGLATDVSDQRWSLEESGNGGYRDGDREYGQEERRFVAIGSY